MATLVYRNAKLWVAQYDFSSLKTQIGVNYESELQDATTMGQTTRIRAGGLKTASIDASGLWDSADDGVDEQYFANIGVADKPVSFSADGGDDGEIGFTMKAIMGSYTPGANIGEMLMFRVHAESTGDLVRGTVMVNGTKTVTANGTERQLGAVGATQKLYAALHVLSATAADTLDVTVRSAAATGMAGATTRITFTQATAITSQWATPVSGAITDTFWDVRWVIGGVDPSFSFVVVVGIK